MPHQVFFSTLVHLSPLLTSTAQLTFAIAEGTSYALVLSSRPTSYANAIFPSFFNNNFYRAISFVLGLNFSSIFGAVVNLRRLAKADIGLDQGLFGFSPKIWYSVGLAGTVGHLLFVPLVAPLIQQLVAGGDVGEGDATMKDEDVIRKRDEKRKEMGVTRDCDRIMQDWLRIHWIRCVVADGVAWVAYLGGILSVLA